ncbi:MAG: phytanoyl-CoA dioxygenase family protein [Lentisphaeria bacterium]|nr:phytanoyl-CoA dioxygenase family protein [Lentisphaeria bacterium]
MQEDNPWFQKIAANRYTPPYSGIEKHSDGNPGTTGTAFSRLVATIFLDDISIDSGALNYVPGSHLLHFDRDDPNYKSPTNEEILAGDFIPAELKAGSVLFRVPCVWHSVSPIKHLRRYISVSYTIRGPMSSWDMANVMELVEKRKHIDLAGIPEELRELWVR